MPDALYGSIAPVNKVATDCIDKYCLKEGETGFWLRRGAVVERHPVRSTGYKVGRAGPGSEVN
jgi:hypothetical protein